jgi:ribosomal protein S21
MVVVGGDCDKALCRFKRIISWSGHNQEITKEVIRGPVYVCHKGAGSN